MSESAPASTGSPSASRSHSWLDAWFAPRPALSDGAAGSPLLVIAGPCLLEEDEANLAIARTLREACAEVGFRFVFKGSFDKANRSSIKSSRGPGLEEGLRRLATVKRELAIPVTTDIHEASQAAPAAETVDLLQIPAFLCRQTDLLAAAGATRCAVNIKKGQFMAPAEMLQAIRKVRESGGDRVMLTERGTFFGYHRLVNDFVGVGDLLAIAGEQDARICFDVTHSTQLPGAEGTSSAGRPERAPLLARAAVAAGVDALFIECHPQPRSAPSDASTMLDLAAVPGLLRRLAAIRHALSVDVASGVALQ
jgi:2-dehydro-3-deoxyphosphooctonate aldolase (KDO 8-P synthase)